MSVLDPTEELALSPSHALHTTGARPVAITDDQVGLPAHELAIEERIRNSILAVRSAGSVVADLREKLKSYEETIYELRAARALLEREKSDAELYRTNVEEVLKAQRARIDEHDATLSNLKNELKTKTTENASLSGQFSSLMEAIDQTFGSPRRPAFPPLKLAS